MQILLYHSAPVGACDSRFGAGECHAQAGPDFDASFCILRDGRYPCPQGELYTDRSVIFRDFSDDRGCENCTCGDPTVGPCTGSMTQYNDATCSSLGQELTTDDCVDALPGMSSGRYVGPLPAVACDPPTVMANGDAQGIGAITVCCSGPAR